MHEIAGNIHLQYEARPGIIAGYDGYLVPKPVDSVMGTASFDAGITVCDEPRLKERRDVIVQKMVDHPVAELSGKNLPHLRVVDNETSGRTGMIRPVQDGVPQTDQLALQIPFKSQLIIFTPLMLSGILVRPEEVKQQLFPGNGKRERNRRR